MKSYLKRLKEHPGVPIAAAFTVIGALVGFGRSENWVAAIVGSAIMSVFWVPVLLTVRKK